MYVTTSESLPLTCIYHSPQEGTGPRVLSAFVEIIFENSDNRIPVRQLTLLLSELPHVHPVHACVAYMYIHSVCTFACGTFLRNI